MSAIDVLFLVVDPMVELVELAHHHARLERHRGLLVVRIHVLQLLVQQLPLVIESRASFWILVNLAYFGVLLRFLKSFVEEVRIDFLQDSTKRNQRFLKDLVPVVLSQIVDSRHQNWEGHFSVSLEDGEEVVIFEETHRSISDLEMISCNASNNAFEEGRNEVFNFFDFTDLEHFLKRGQEERLFD